VHCHCPASLYLPGPQATGLLELDPARHTYPAVHNPEHDGVDMPGSLLKVPCAQGAQDAAPVPLLWRPGGHSWAVAFTDPAGQAYPAAQGPLQPLSASAWSDPYRPDGHRVHKPAEPTL
jgi:hypothetical protein